MLNLILQMDGYLAHAEKLNLSADEIKKSRLGVITKGISRLPNLQALQPLLNRAK